MRSFDRRAVWALLLCAWTACSDSDGAPPDGSGDGGVDAAVGSAATPPRKEGAASGAEDPSDARRSTADGASPSDTGDAAQVDASPASSVEASVLPVDASLDAAGDGSTMALDAQQALPSTDSGLPLRDAGDAGPEQRDSASDAAAPASDAGDAAGPKPDAGANLSCGAHGTLNAERTDCICDVAYADSPTGECAAVRAYPGPCRIEHEHLFNARDWVDLYTYDAQEREVLQTHDGYVEGWSGSSDVIDGTPETRHTTAYSYVAPNFLVDKLHYNQTALVERHEVWSPTGGLLHAEEYQTYASEGVRHKIQEENAVLDAKGRTIRMVVVTGEPPTHITLPTWFTIWDDNARTRYTYIDDFTWWRETFDPYGKRVRYETYEALDEHYFYDAEQRIVRLDEYSCTHLQHLVTERYLWTYVALPGGGTRVEQLRYWPGDGGCLEIGTTPANKWVRDYDRAGNPTQVSFDPFGGESPREFDRYSYACWSWCPDGSARADDGSCP